MIPRSLLWRLSLGVVLAVTLLWGGTALVTFATLQNEVAEVFDSALQETAQRILPLAVLDILDREEEGMTRSVAALNSYDDFFAYVVRDAKGKTLLRSRGAEKVSFPPYQSPGFITTDTHRIYYDAAMQESLTIAIAEPLAHRHKVSLEMISSLVSPLGVLVPFTLLVVWALVHFSVRKVHVLRAAIEKRGSGDLAPLEVQGVPVELDPVVDAVNRLLERLRRALEAERSFTANSAHELRTPVAAALAQTQRLISETRDKAARARARQIELSLQRLSRLSEKLMQLAKAEGGRLRAEQATDIRQVLRMVVDEIRMTAEGAERLKLSMPDTAVMSEIDLDAFAILVRNLVENALKHGSAEGSVTVELSADGRLVVTNAGMTVPQDDLERLSRPFERGKTAADGAGLGLAIAQAIASGAGGRLELHSPVPGEKDGFQAVFQLNSGA
ncbi:MAG: ATP-binding protein [Paracoccaceae bacterium]|nr:ATP-binding protein [Paracoccaceae bacterium]